MGGIYIKKLLVLNIATGFGGAEKSLTDILKKLDKRYKIYFVAENDKLIQLLKRKEFSYEKIQTGSLKSLTGIFKYIYGIIRLLLTTFKYKPDIILSNTVRSHILGASLSFLTRINLIWVLRDYQFNKKIKKLLEFIPEKIICVSQHLKEYYNGGQKYVVIPNGINLNEVQDEYDLDYRKEANIQNNEVVFGLASTFARWKGIEYLIEGFYEAQKETDDFKGQVLIAGDAKENTEEYEYYLELKKLVKKLNLKNKIHFVGWVDDILKFFYNCNVVVSSSVSEGSGPESFGRTIIEAWTVKKPVITTNVGGPKEIVEDSDNGLKVSEKDLKEIKKAILKMMNNEDLRKKLGKNGYRKIEKAYNLNFVSKFYYSTIKETI